MQVQLLHQLCSFHRDSHSSRIINGPGSQVPGVEMTRNNHHLLRMLGAFQVSHHIEGAHFFRGLRSQDDVHAHLGLRREMRDQVGVFAAHRSRGNVGGIASSGMG